MQILKPKVMLMKKICLCCDSKVQNGKSNGSLQLRAFALDNFSKFFSASYLNGLLYYDERAEGIHTA